MALHNLKQVGKRQEQVTEIAAAVAAPTISPVTTPLQCRGSNNVEVDIYMRILEAVAYRYGASFFTAPIPIEYLNIQSQIRIVIDTR